MTASEPLVVVRADASQRIGSGHVRRCQSLAAALMLAGARVEFLQRPGDGRFHALLNAGSMTVHLLPAADASTAMAPANAVAYAAWLGVDWCTDAQQTIDLLSDRQVAAIVVDHYAIDARWHAKVAAATGAKIVVIDDIGDRQLAADLIVDHNHAPDHRVKYRSVNRLACPVLGGPSYALLARSYQSATRNSAADPVCSIGIFMGGVDLHNHSVSVLRGIRDFSGFTGSVEIATTSANPNLASLQHAAQLDGNTCVRVDLDDLARFFGRHELHVGAGGGATWERCCMGAPALALVVAENQRSVLLPLAHLEVVDLLEQPAPSSAAIGARVGQLLGQPEYRQRIARNAMLLVDGLGCARVCTAILRLCQA